MCRWMAMSAVIGAVLPQPLAWSSSSESGHPLGDHGPWHLRAGGGAVHSIKTGSGPRLLRVSCHGAGCRKSVKAEVVGPLAILPHHLRKAYSLNQGIVR